MYNIINRTLIRLVTKVAANREVTAMSNGLLYLWEKIKDAYRCFMYDEVYNDETNRVERTKLNLNSLHLALWIVVAIIVGLLKLF